MTRLTEALERARASGYPAPTPLPKGREGGHHSVGDVPSSWRIEQEAVEAVDDHRPVDETRNAARLQGDAAGGGAGARRTGAPSVTAKTSVSPPQSADRSGERLQHKSGDAATLWDSPAGFGVVEQYRRLAAALHHAQVESAARKLMVTSAVESEGKTLTATNLALTLSQSYQRRVLLVDADLRRPSIHQLLKLDNRSGLSDTLKRLTAGGQLPVQEVSPTLWVLTAGRPDPDPMSGLVSDVMRQFLEEAAEQFDWVVIDTPPIGLLPDANLLAAMVDKAVLIVSAGTTPYALVTRAIDAIGQPRILGVVLNRTDMREAQLHSYGSYSYSYTGPQKRKPRRFGFSLGGKR